ncbi:MAG: DNA mismatch repair protein MutS, partial [Pseudomonadota bacterium]
MNEITTKTDAPIITPAMQQYLASKQAYPDCLLFYRMGDFYELFFEDAIKASSVLGIALTKRGKHNGEDIPMCGVPAHSADGYLETLIASGCKVAICEQMEDAEEAKKRGAKAVMRREVVRIVTPGTITEDSLLNSKKSNYLCAIAKKGEEYSLAWLEVSTGEFCLSSVLVTTISSELARIEPEEIIISETLAQELKEHEFWLEWQKKSSIQSDNLFDFQKSERILKNYYNVASLDFMGELTRADISVCSGLIEYLNLTQISAMPRLEYPKKIGQNSYLVIDAATRRNLEITHSQSGEKNTSLLAVIDRTITNIGARKLASYLAAPLTNPPEINQRLNAITFFIDEEETRKILRAWLKEFPDIERSLSRICLDRGSPRDLLAINAGLEVVNNIKKHFFKMQHIDLPDLISNNIAALAFYEEIALELNEALKKDVPMLARDGNFVREGYSATLDEFRLLRDESKRLIAALETNYQQETGINTLKIRYNNVLGYYAEITSQHQKKITDRFIHRQSLANALRYTTQELGDLERKISEAADKAVKLELEIFANLVAKIKESSANIAKIANAIAIIDVSSALAELAKEKNYSRPSVDESSAFEIKGGRHPIVEYVIAKNRQGQFISNDCDLNNTKRLWLLTGPN